jgi:hypothetical protein
MCRTRDGWTSPADTGRGVRVCPPELTTLPPESAKYQALVSAQTCDQILAAWPLANAVGSACPDDYSCRGDLYVADCASGTVNTAVDCGIHGTTCQPDVGSNGGGCVEAGVAVPPPCGSGAAGCNGEFLASCQSPSPTANIMGLVRDCAADGLECASGGCVPASCPVAASGCDGEVAQICNGAGEPAVATDCAAQGQVCTDDAMGPRCVTEIPTTECSESTHLSPWVGTGAHCVDARFLAYCYGSDDLRFVDCRAIGGTGCNDGGFSGLAECF